MFTEEMTAWLGDAAADLEALGDDAVDRFARAWVEVEDRYPGEDDADRRHAALSAAVQYLLGEVTIDEVGDHRAATRRSALEASAEAQQVALMAVEDGVPEAQAAKRAQVDRKWLRRLLGK